MLASFLCCHSTTETLNLTLLSMVGVSMRGGLMRGIKIPLQDGALKMPGGLMREGGGGGGGVFAGHYGSFSRYTQQSMC